LVLKPGRPNYTRWLLSFALTALAFTVWMLDYKRIVCDPANHFFQAHALWHVLTALAVPQMAIFYAALI
jgi:hypothetical protein